MPRKSIPRKISVDAKLAARVRRSLIHWFRKHGRDLPWRRTRDPYHVLVSEFMLQQTQVSRVEGYYHRFLDAYPTVQALAQANPKRVRESWEGLGYYRRAANLHRLAREVVAGGGAIPSEPEALRRLPGVGRYTAGAVASFAFERPAAAVDTNVARVLRRLFAPRLPKAGTEKRVWEIAEQVIPRRRGAAAWAFNQAIMELGATVCTARVMRCGECPVRRACATGKNSEATLTRGPRG